MSDSRLDQFIAPRPVIAGKQLAPFSAGRLQLCRKAGLRLLDGQPISQDELEDELIAFWFIHTAPVEAAKSACALGRDQFFSQHIDPLKFDFPASELPKIMGFLSREFAATNETQVEVVSKPGDASGPQPPPNS
jgi:hypothetical protein